MDDVAFRSGPARGRVPAQILRHLFRRDHRAIRAVTGHAWRTVANNLLAHFGPQSVRANQQAARPRFAAGQANRDRIAVLIVALDHTAGTYGDPGILLAGPLKNAMHVAA